MRSWPDPKPRVGSLPNRGALAPLRAKYFRETSPLEKLKGVSAWSATTWISLILEYSTKKATVARELSQASLSNSLCVLKLPFWFLFVWLLSLSLHYFYICQENKDIIYWAHKAPKVNSGVLDCPLSAHSEWTAPFRHDRHDRHDKTEAVNPPPCFVSHMI